MKKEKFNLDKPKKEAKKHEKKSISLINELKIDKEEKEKDLLPEEIESYYWEKLYKEKLDKIKDNKDFKKAVFEDLENDIKKGKSGKEINPKWVLWTLSNLKNLNLYPKELAKKLKNIKNSVNFKEATIKDLENNIKKGKNGNGWDFNLAIRVLSSIKNLNLYKKQVKEKLKEIKDGKNSRKEVLDDLEYRIKSGQKGGDSKPNTVEALRTISSMKNLNLYPNKLKEKLSEIKKSMDFKNQIEPYSKDILLSENWDITNGWVARKALRIISAIKDISSCFEELAQEKRAKMARKTQKQDIPKRPEIR